MTRIERRTSPGSEANVKSNLRYNARFQNDRKEAVDRDEASQSSSRERHGQEERSDHIKTGRCYMQRRRRGLYYPSVTAARAVQVNPMAIPTHGDWPSVPSLRACSDFVFVVDLPDPDEVLFTSVSVG